MRLYVSANRRFLVTADGKPFFWLGDTAWELIHRCTREEVDYYLENRQRKGFNVIQAVVLAELDGLHTPNMYGYTPLINDDPTQPNEDYFTHVDYVIHKAAEKGMYIALLPTWGDKVNPRWGIGPQIFTPDNAFIYGRYIANRYKDAENIIWVNGGDRIEVWEDVDYAPVWRSLAEGIIAGSTRKPLITYHPQGERGSSMVFHEDEWLSFNMWQSGHGGKDKPNWSMITSDYNRSPVKPVLDAEPNYEDHPISFKPDTGTFDEHDVRKAAYRAVFAGAFGHTYGHHNIWQMYTKAREGKTLPILFEWKPALDRPGASQLIHLKNLMLSRPFLTRIPDQSVIASGEGTGSKHIRATRSSDGSYAMVYMPTQQTLAVNLDVITDDKVIAWWYNPRTGEASRIGEFAAENSQVFIEPDNDGPDWVLVLDALSKNFPPPGQIL